MSVIAPSGHGVFRSKVSIPSDLRTRQWAALPAWIRERSFFMAGIADAEIIDGFRSVTDRFIKGELGLAEARNELRKVLVDEDYAPQPGQEGTIKDLRTIRRMNVILETNQLAVNGFARWARQQAALRGFPAQRLVRVRRSTVERIDWDARWEAAHASAGMPDGATGPEDKIALVNHPIWQAMGNGAGGFTDTLGNPYPPFAFGSGMGVEPISRHEADLMGILPNGESDPAFKFLLEPQDRGLNAALEAHPRIQSQKVREALADHLKGLADWNSESEPDGRYKLIFTDPNGTRATTAADLAAVWERGMPAGMPALQKDALVDWVSDHANFKQTNPTDRWTDLQRLHARLVNTIKPEVLCRGLHMANEKLETFLLGIQHAGYSVRPQYPGESFTISSMAAANYAATAGQGWSVILEVANPSANSFKDLSPLVRAFASEIRKQKTPPVVTESEWLLKPGVAFQVASVDKDSAARTVRIKLRSSQAEGGKTL